tara:strand:- start:126 stop:1592 length:1467 start_codon:yes stop_codon:yes gene_type:complete
MPPSVYSDPPPASDQRTQRLIKQLCAVEFDCSNELRSQHLNHVVSLLANASNDAVAIGVSALFRWVRHVVTSMGPALWVHDKAILVEGGAIPLLVAMLRPHTPPTLQAKAANVLTLLVDTDTITMIWQVNGVEALIDRDGTTFGSTESRIAAKNTLGKLATLSSSTQQRIVAVGGIESTLNLLNTNIPLVHVPTLLLALNRMVRANKEAHRTIRECNGISIVVSAWNKLNTNSTFACEILCVLASDHSNHGAILDAKGLSTFVAMMRPSSNYSAQSKEQAADALLHIASSKAVHAAAVLDSLDEQFPPVLKQAFVNRLKHVELARLLKAQNASDATHLATRIACAEVVGVESHILKVARERLSIINGDDARLKKRKAFGLENMDPPVEFVCPITLETMKDPVVASDGNSYERAAIELVFARGDQRSPLSRELLHKTLFPNRNLRQRIQAHEEDMICVAERVTRHVVPRHVTGSGCQNAPLSLTNHVSS